MRYSLETNYRKYMKGYENYNLQENLETSMVKY